MPPRKYEFWELTTTETAILALIACGLQDKQIATQLGITPRYVRGAGTLIFSKLNVQNRVQATRRALSMGIVTIEEAWAMVRPGEAQASPRCHDDRMLLVTFAPATPQEAMVLAHFYFDMAERMLRKEER